MIVDCHTHLQCSERGKLTEEHQRLCKNVDACFVLAGAGPQRNEWNADLETYLRQTPKAYGFAAVNPLDNDITTKRLKSLKNQERMVGVVLYCAEEDFHPAHSRALQLYEAAEQEGLIVFFHNCPPFSQTATMGYAQPWLLDEVARLFPRLRIVIGRMGLPFYLQTLCLLGKHENVFADLTIHPQKIWQVYNLIMGAYEAGVMDKLLFGSGFPSAEPDHCIETLLGFNKMLADTHLPQVPREKLRSIVERDSLKTLGIK
ncbi:MAG: amidohydrolase family protein [Planctomycetes bacterium]|jgi:predicted TIM-barrel fold metal-dependent hydrolase|nr:amidohydrolase family protein [Planctomycetota bacterium]